MFEDDEKTFENFKNKILYQNDRNHVNYKHSTKLIITLITSTVHNKQCQNFQFMLFYTS